MAQKIFERPLTRIYPNVLTRIGDVPAVVKAFRFILDTTKPGTASDTFRVPTRALGSYNCTVNFGEGGPDEIITTFDDARWTHVYSVSGVYTITITGEFTGFRFNNGGDRQKLLEITEWGPFRLGNEGGYFYGCNNIELDNVTDVLDLTGTTDFTHIFRSCPSLTTIANVDLWDVSNITSFFGAFRAATSFIAAIGPWITSSLVDMTNCFDGCSVFNTNINNWDMSKVTNMSFSFRGTFAFDQPVGLWNVSAVQNFQFAWLNSTNFDQDISTWIPTSATNMTAMLQFTSFSQTNYDPTLIAWDLLTLKNGVSADFGSAKFGAGAPATARANIISNFSWTISDGGPA